MAEYSASLHKWAHGVGHRRGGVGQSPGHTDDNQKEQGAGNCLVQDCQAMPRVQLIPLVGRQDADKPGGNPDQGHTPVQPFCGSGVIF